MSGFVAESSVSYDLYSLWMDKVELLTQVYYDAVSDVVGSILPDSKKCFVYEDEDWIVLFFPLIPHNGFVMANLLQRFEHDDETFIHKIILEDLLDEYGDLLPVAVLPDENLSTFLSEYLNVSVYQDFCLDDVTLEDLFHLHIIPPPTTDFPLQKIPLYPILEQQNVDRYD
ncbi:hypothetical protein K7432_017639 [Basidiobolus ranarum]|uniref:Uncharacterized protein n=1 Tax=Basidiobolus ranarum TaxID=34480 RepID=A0ABR2WD48_9FUNG